MTRSGGPSLRHPLRWPMRSSLASARHRAGAAARARQGQPRRQCPVRARRRRPVDPPAHFHRADAGEAAQPRRLERRFVQPFCGALFAGYPDLAYAPRSTPAASTKFEVDEFFFQAGTRLSVAAAQQNYICANYTHALRYVLEARGQRGRRNSSPSAWAWRDPLQPELQSRHHARSARRAERGRCDFCSPARSIPSCRSCRAMPSSPPSANSTCCSRGRATDFPLFGPPREPVDLAEYAAGMHVARIVADGGTLQLGIGSLGDAVAQALILRHRRQRRFSPTW